jgi:hypothetical protein
MPKAFRDCVAGGGKVRTIVPEAGKYLHVCHPKGGGPSVAGEVKTTQGTPAKSITKKSKPKYKILNNKNS